MEERNQDMIVDGSSDVKFNAINIVDNIICYVSEINKVCAEIDNYQSLILSKRINVTRQDFMEVYKHSEMEFDFLCNSVERNCKLLLMNPEIVYRDFKDNSMAKIVINKLNDIMNQISSFNRERLDSRIEVVRQIMKKIVFIPL